MVSAIKNYWNTHIGRKLLSRGVDPVTHRLIIAGDAPNSSLPQRSLPSRSDSCQIKWKRGTKTIPTATAEVRRRSRHGGRTGSPSSALGLPPPWNSPMPAKEEEERQQRRVQAFFFFWSQVLKSQEASSERGPVPHSIYSNITVFFFWK